MALPKELDALTPKQKEFVLSYIETKNGTEAARRAGYKGNDKTLGQMAYENLEKPEIKAAVHSLTSTALKRHEINIENVVKEIATVAFEDRAKVKDRDKLSGLKMLGDHVGAWKQTDLGNAQRFQFAVNMSEDEARAMLQSLLKSK